LIDLGTAPTAGGPRLLAGWVATHGRADLTAHVARYGPLPDPAGLIGVVEAAGLRGRGGAWFPTATKLRAVAGGRRAGTVVANGVDAEPASDKDNVLLTVAPHLVLDGGVLAAAEVGARDVVVCVRRGAPLVGAVIAAIRQRADPVPVRVAEIPARYVASEESALAHYLTTGEARPTDRPPPVSERGVRGRPTLVDNVETLADIALIARYGADWFRAVGTPSAPGTALVTTGGAVARPGVSEVPVGAAISAVCAVSATVGAPVLIPTVRCDSCAAC
jgi:NADH:ubiquinone oxidoreductase subunit F (NADH-binding)